MELRMSFYQIDSISQSGMYILNTVKLVIGNQILLGLDNLSPNISMYKCAVHWLPYFSVCIGIHVCVVVTVYICMCSGYLL